MNVLRMSLVSLALCSLFAASSARADDCSDALVAESCSCRSEVRGQGSELRAGKKTSLRHPLSAQQKVAGAKIPRLKAAAER